MSSDKSYSSLLVRPEMSTSIVLNTACPSLWSSTGSIHEIQPSCFLHITLWEKIDCLFIILRRFYQQRSPFCLHKHEKDMGSPRLFTDLLVKVRRGLQLQGHICWDQIEKSAWVSLSPIASPLRRVGTTHHLSHCLHPRAGVAGQENIARSPLVWEDLD